MVLRGINLQNLKKIPSKTPFSGPPKTKFLRAVKTASFDAQNTSCLIGLER